jgi:flavin reductase (DIM6/NTAB) family NADH-FMN oxidoreductase RutF
MNMFCEREFRDVVGRFPAGVSIATACAANGKPAGVTISSLTSVSLQPALISFSLAISVRSLPVFRAARYFAVSILAEDQHAICRSFATAGHDKWASVETEPSLHGCPIIRPNVAAFECERYACHLAGDHLIFIGRVLRLAPGEKENPLVFFRSGFHRLCKTTADGETVAS